MANTIDAYCNTCKSYTFFTYDGEDWECQRCGSLNSQSGSCDSETPYPDYRERHY